MPKKFFLLLPVLLLFLAATPATQPAPLDISTNWQPLHAGEALGSITQTTDAGNHLLEIIETHAAAPLKGRTGALNPLHLNITEDQYYDITFTAHTARATVGLVFSFETPDGQVLARTTLPEIGRKPQDTSDAPLSIDQWLHYTVALHARASAPDASLTITPIEPTDITLNHLTLTVRAPETK